MFYGPPGTGKTSTVTAITSYLKRNLYRINLVAPGLCDDSLMSAMQRVPRESVIVFEDIESLFGIHRDKNETFSVTFSGLLNSIDGICDSTRGLIFMFTTNHLDKVDNALKRCGRIDRSFYLGHCCTQQMVDMFLRFYPSEDEHAKLFAKNCMSKAKHMTPAEAQHHFIMHRKSDSLKAATEIIVERKNDSNSEAMYS
jgi:chaperone BCS1